MRGGRREEELFVSREEPPARCLSATIGDSPNVAPVDAHDVLLVTRTAISRALERQPLPIVTEIGLCIFTAERDLPDGSEVCLAWLRRNDALRARRIGVRYLRVRCRAGSCAQRADERNESVSHAENLKPNLGMVASGVILWE